MSTPEPLPESVKAAHRRKLALAAKQAGAPTQPNRSTPEPASIELETISEREARLLVNRIRDHINDARALVLELYEREGWRPLGYNSWAECVVAEFDHSRQHLYRLLDAAKVERNLSPAGDNGLIPERVLRPLAGLAPDQQREAWNTATETSPTAEHVARAAEKFKQAPKKFRELGFTEAKDGAWLAPGVTEEQRADAIAGLNLTRSKNDEVWAQAEKEGRANSSQKKPPAKSKAQKLMKLPMADTEAGDEEKRIRQRFAFFWSQLINDRRFNWQLETCAIVIAKYLNEYLGATNTVAIVHVESDQVPVRQPIEYCEVGWILLTTERDLAVLALTPGNEKWEESALGFFESLRIRKIVTVS